MVDVSDAAAQRGTPWYEDEGWIREPVFADVPFEQSGWRPIVEVLERVNLAKARLLVSIYEAQVRVAYQQYRAVRQEEETRFAAERTEAERRNDALREQIHTVERAMAQARAHWQPQLDALREQLYPAWQDAYTKAAQAGINLRGDPLMGDALQIDTSAQLPGGHSAVISATEPLSPAYSAGQNPPAIPAASAQQPPSLTPAEVMHEQNLPGYQGYLIPKPLWAALVVLVGSGLGLILAFTAGIIAPGRAINEPLPVVLALVAGVALTYLWARALWGAVAIVAELYHLFGWHAGKARRAAWSIGAGLVLLVLMAGLLTPLLMGMARATASPGGWIQLALLTTALMMLPLLACALLEGFLEGRYKPVGHQIAARITQHEREQSQRANETGSGGLGTGNAEAQDGSSTGETLSAASNAHAPSETEQAAWVAIRRYQALYRQYSHLKGEMEQELAPYREQIEQLKTEMRPIYPALPPHSRNRIMFAYRHWEQRYRSYLQHLADALRECQGGEELAAIVLEQVEIRELSPLPGFS